MFDTLHCFGIFNMADLWRQLACVISMSRARSVDAPELSNHQNIMAAKKSRLKLKTKVSFIIVHLQYCLGVIYMRRVILMNSRFYLNLFIPF